MALKLANNATTVLAAATSAGATTLQVINTTRFPTLTGIDWVYATLVSLTGGFDSFGNPNTFEIVRINGPFTPGATALNVTRAQDGTAAIAFAPGDVCDLRINRQTLLDAAASGAVSSVTATNPSLTIAPTTGAVLAAINLANSNTWTANQGITKDTPTFTLETTNTTPGLGGGAYSVFRNTSGQVGVLGVHGTAYTNPGTPFLANQMTMESYGVGGMIVNAWGVGGDIVFATANGLAAQVEQARILAAGGFRVATLTSGRATYAGASGLLSDNANYVFDSANVRLGVGNSSPQRRVHATTATAEDTYRAEVSTNGVADFTGYGILTNGTIAGYLRSTVSAFASSGLNVANSTQLVGAKAGGLYLFALDAAGAVVIGTGGATSSNERMQFDAAGNVTVNTAALATGATDGFLYITTSAGPPTGAATAKTGRAPIHIDTTNNAFYFRSGGSWRSTPAITLPGNTTTFYRGDGTFSSTLTGPIATVGATFTGNVDMTADVQITGLRRMTRTYTNDGTSGGAGKTIDFSSVLYHKVQATGNATLTFTAPATTDAEIIFIIQGDGSLRTFNWPASVVWEKGIAVSMPTATDDFAEVRGRYSSTGPTYYLTWGQFGY